MYSGSWLMCGFLPKLYQSFCSRWNKAFDRLFIATWRKKEYIKTSSFITWNGSSYLVIKDVWAPFLLHNVDRSIHYYKLKLCWISILITNFDAEKKVHLTLGHQFLLVSVILLLSHSGSVACLAPTKRLHLPLRLTAGLGTCALRERITCGLVSLSGGFQLQFAIADVHRWTIDDGWWDIRCSS